MKIQIVDKNDNAWFWCDENVLYTQNQDETLDSANVRVSHLKSEIEIEPFDRVVLYDETGRFFDNYFYLAIDTYERLEEGIDEPTYTYDISLFSETKLLETEILPNLKTTQQLTPYKSLYDYMSIYLNLYGKKIRIGGEWENAWTLDSSQRFYDKFNVTCPEQQWNTPTLREVLTDLMMVVDCIPTMRNGVISFIDLREIGNEIEFYNYVRKSQSSADYLSNIRMQMTNVMQTQIAGVKNSVSRTEFIHFTSPTMKITSEDTILETMYPILNIKHLWMCATTGSYKLMKFDLCAMLNPNNNDDTVSSFVKEKKEYDTLQTLYRGFQNSTSIGIALINASTISSYQNYCVYYNRYGKTIEGWNRLTKQYFSNNWGIEETTLTYLQTLLQAWSTANGTIGGNSNSYFKAFFEIEYETTMDALCSTTKQDYPSNSRTIMDNQTNSFVDAFSQGRLEVNKANRLGNVMFMINQRIEEDDNINKLLKIKDTYKGAIVYQAQYQIYTDHCEVNAYACLNYILRDYWTGIKSRPRTYNNAQDEALERHDLFKKFAEFSFNRCNEYLYDGDPQYYPQQTKDLASWCVSPLKNGLVVAPIKYAFVKTSKGTTAYPESGYEFALDCISRVIGNSVVFTFGFTDNTIVGKYVDVNDINGVGDVSDEDVTEYGGILMQYAKYVDDRYEFQDIYFKLLTNINFLGNDGTMPTEDGEQLYVAGARALWERLCLTPKIATDVYTSSDVKASDCILNYYKDNRETPTISYQIEYCCDNRDIYFNTELVREHQGVRTADTSTSNIVIYKGDYVYGKDNLTDLTATGYTLSISNTNVYTNAITFYGGDIEGYKGGLYAVRNGKILLGVNFKETGTKIIYLNILKDRDKFVYTTNSSGTKVKGGSIIQ